MRRMVANVGVVDDSYGLRPGNLRSLAGIRDHLGDRALHRHIVLTLVNP